MDAQAYLDLMDARYAVRKYVDTQLSAEQLDFLLAVAQKAPSAKNMQPIRLCVVQSEEGLAKIDAATPCRYGAPTVIIGAYDSTASLKGLGYETGDFGDIDTSIALTNIANAAAAAGLGTCWVGRYDAAAIRESFNVPESYVLVDLLMVGTPAPDSKPAPRHTETLPLEQLVVRESY